MNKTLMHKLKLGILGLFSVGLLAACNTTDEFEKNPDMGPPSATEEPADGENDETVTEPGTGGDEEAEEEAE